MRTPALAIVLLLVVGGCATGDRGPTVTVLAASSLTDALGAAAADFTDRTGVPVRLSFAGSQQLARQLLDGAAADVFVSADPRYAEEVVRARGARRGPLAVATNVLVIAVEPGNPRSIEGLPDLEDASLTVALPAPEVPAGAYARQLLDRRGLSIPADTLEPSVRATLARVTLGEADAAIVYASDAVAAGDEVATLPLPDSPVARYPAVILDDAPAPDRAAAFVEHLRSPAGRAILREHGLGPAPSGGSG